MRRSRLVSALCMLLSAVALTVAPSAPANIIIGQSIAGVKLGDSEAQVKAALRGQSNEHPPVFHSELLYSDFLRIVFKHGRADKLVSYSSTQKTSKGITVGSSQAQVKHAYPKITCEEGQHPIYVYCVTGGHIHGHTSYTGFLCEGTVGVVEIELAYGSVAKGLREP